MRKGVLLALAILAVCSWFLIDHVASAEQKPVACGLTCLTEKSKDESQCTGLDGDTRRQCAEKASLKYRMCTQTCPNPQAKNGPAPALTRTSIRQD